MTRPDRDSYLDILWDHVKESNKDQDEAYDASGGASSGKKRDILNEKPGYGFIDQPTNGRTDR